jgi:hypothetical protein
MAEPRSVLRPPSEGGENPLNRGPSFPDDAEAQWQDREQDEYSPLLPPGAGSDGKWDDAVLKGLVDTTLTRETKLLTSSAAPLVLTFILQYSLTVASIFTVGHIGKVELGAVSLAHSASTQSLIASHR